MNLEHLIYYGGFLAAISLCWGLGRLFVIPMILDLALDICMLTVDFPGGIVRWMVMGYGLAIFIWVLALSGAFSRSMFFSLTLLELSLIISRLWVPMQTAGTGFDFWSALGGLVYDIWMISVFVVVLSVAVKSSLIAKLSGRRVDLLTNPRKRFLLPIGAWAAITVLPNYFQPYLTDAFLANQYKIAGQVLVWGWVALELPSYITHKRLMKQYS